MSAPRAKRKPPTSQELARELELERAKSKATRDLLFGLAEAVGVGILKGFLAPPKTAADAAGTKALELGHRCELQQFPHLVPCACFCSSCCKARGDGKPKP